LGSNHKRFASVFLTNAVILKKPTYAKNESCAPGVAAIEQFQGNCFAASFIDYMLNSGFYDVTKSRTEPVL
jgi:hypothetical protein